LTVFQKKNKKSQTLSSMVKNLNIPETNDLISELEDMSMVQTSSNIETKTESTENAKQEGIQEEQQSGFKSFMRKWFKITW
jgi:ribosomal protein L7/L12